MKAVVVEVVDDDEVNDRLTLSLSLWEFQEAVAPTPITEDDEAEEAMVSGLVVIEFFVSSTLSLTSSSPSFEVLLSSLLSFLTAPEIDEEDFSLLLSFTILFLSPDS